MGIFIWRKPLVLLAILWVAHLAEAQRDSPVDEEVLYIRTVYDEVLTNGHCYDWLRSLTQDVGPRLAGSPGAAASVDLMSAIMDTLGFDSMWLQEVQVPHWDRGPMEEEVRIVSSPILGTIDLASCALGNSVGTPSGGITARVVEVHSLDEVRERAAEMEGKIVFYNRPMDVTKLRTFGAYGGAVDQRGAGAIVAAEAGAVGVLVRSVTTAMDDYPHTGGMYYEEGVAKIPAMAISTLAAEKLSQGLSLDPDLRVHMVADCRMLSDRIGHNVIGEIRGSLYPEEIILVGGHLDSWDLGEGAHDDGAGCVQSVEVARTLLARGYEFQRTLRVVLFANEENGLKGGLKYAEEALRQNEKHLAALESDAGGFTPRGFSIEAQKEVFEGLSQLKFFKEVLSAYDLYIDVGGSGADIGPLKKQGAFLIGYRPDSQRYFDYHHAASDTFDKVNKRELELGAAAMASFVYLIDKYVL